MSKTTENYGLTKPEVGEFFSLETWNENMDKIDGELKKREDAQKESDNLLMNPKFTEAKERKNLTSGEKIHLMLGKISRFFSDMKAIAFSGSYNDLVDKPKIPTVLNNQTTTEEGYALDARQANPNIDGTLAKQLSDLNGSLNSTVVFDQDSIQITKISPHAYILHIDKLISLSEAWKEIVLGDIPFSCADTSANIVTQDGDAIWLSIVNNKLKINTLVPSHKGDTYIRCAIVISN